MAWKGTKDWLLSNVCFALSSCPSSLVVVFVVGGVTVGVIGVVGVVVIAIRCCSAPELH